MWPSHYRDFVERHSLAGREAFVPDSQDAAPRWTIGLYSEAEGVEEADEFYPGLVVKQHGYVPIGQDLTGGGDPFFINVNDAPPGPVYCIYHDSVHDLSYDPDEAIGKVLDSYEALIDFLSIEGQP